MPVVICGISKDGFDLGIFAPQVMPELSFALSLFITHVKGIKMKSVKKINAIDNVVKSLANSEPVKNSVTLSDTSKTLWVDYARHYKDGENSKTMLVDSLFADGIRSYHIVGANDEDKSLVQLRHQIIQLIISASPDDVKLYNAEPKTLSLTMQSVQTILKTKTIPTIIGNVKKALARREVSASKTDGKAKPKTPQQMVKHYVKQAIEKLQKMENGYAGFTKDLETLKTLSVLKQVK